VATCPFCAAPLHRRAVTKPRMALVRRGLAAALAMLAAAPCCANAAAISGVQKVIQMLDDMSAKAKQEKNDEEVAFAKFKSWCSAEVPRLQGEIKKAGETMELLSSSIEKGASDAKALAEEVKKLSAGREKFEADLKAANEHRAQEHAAFLETEKDFSESVDAIERALATLQEQAYDRPGAAAALLQLASSSRLPAKARDIVTAFMAMMDGDDGDDYSQAQAPEANAYEFQSGGVVDLLKRLQDEFRGKLTTAQKEEMNSAHAHKMVAMDLQDAIENGEKDAQEKAQQRERKLAKKGEDEKRLQATTAGKAADEATLGDVTAECTEKQASYEEKQKLRQEEIEAIAKATEIMKSSSVSGSADKHLSLAQRAAGASAMSLLQVQRSGAAAAEQMRGLHKRLRDFLASEGRRLHSKDLALLSEKLAADPFAKVKKMIDAMITRLLEEANEDAQHEGFCDKELGKSKVTRNKLSEDIDSLKAAVDDGKATILSLTEEIGTLHKEVQELEQAMGDAVALREEEKARNEATVKDAQEAQRAVQQAMAVLKDFYTKALTATALLQSGAAAPAGPGGRASLVATRQGGIKMGSGEWRALANPDYEGKVDKGHKEGMQTFGDAYQGQQDEAEFGVLGLLEVILSDFSNLEADTKSAEAAAAESFSTFMAEGKRNKATKLKKVEMDEADKAAAEAKLADDTEDLRVSQDKLLAADRYHEKLVPQCIDQGVTWEERVAARQAEIDSLKGALELLSGSDIA